MNRIVKFSVFLFLFLFTWNLMSVSGQATSISRNFQCKSGPLASIQPFEVESLLQVEKLGEEENQEPVMSAVSIQYQEVEKVEEEPTEEPTVVLTSAASPVSQETAVETTEITEPTEPTETSETDGAHSISQSSVSVDLSPYQGDIYEMAKIVYKEAYSVKPLSNASRKTQWSAVVWTILNRYDRGYGRLYQIYSAKHQYAYYPKVVPPQEVIEVVEDTVKNWLLEKEGVYQGRVLPKDYLWFVGDGKNNIFRNRYSGKYSIWDWSLEDYYANY